MDINVARDKKKQVVEALKGLSGVIGIGIASPSFEGGEYLVVVNVLTPEFEKVKAIVEQTLGNYPSDVRSFSDIPKARS